MTAPWAFQPLRPAGRNHPASAVLVSGDEACARQAVLTLCRILTVEDFAALQHHADLIAEADDLTQAEVDAQLAGFDEVLGDACRHDGTALTDVWKLRVGAEEVRAFLAALVNGLASNGVTRIEVPA